MDVSPLRKLRLFASLNDKQLEQISTSTVVRTYPKNAIILHEGDEAASLYAIESGEVKVYLSNEEGKEIIINVLGAGDFFGELALIDNSPRSASVKTTVQTKLIMIPKSVFNEVFDSQSGLAMLLLVNLTHRVRYLSESIRSLALMDVYGRVAKALLEMAQEDKGRLVISVKPTQQDIANRIGASREMVARIMKDLTVGGYIVSKNNKIIINEPLPKGY